LPFIYNENEPVIVQFFFLAIRIKKFLHNMQSVMLSRSILILFTNRNFGFH